MPRSERRVEYASGLGSTRGTIFKRPSHSSIGQSRSLIRLGEPVAERGGRRTHFWIMDKGSTRQLCWAPTLLHGQYTTKGCIAPTWSWANFDGPVYFDDAYYSPHHQYVYWTEVADTPTDSTKKLTLRGLALRSRILSKRSVDLYGNEHHVTHLSLDTLETPRIPPSSSTEIWVHWDENGPHEDVDPEGWSRLQEQRNSQLLFLVIRSTRHSDGEMFQGLVLRMLPHFADEPILYCRVGTFTIHDNGDHALRHAVSWLALHEYDTEDSTAAGLIQTVAII